MHVNYLELNSLAFSALSYSSDNKHDGENWNGSFAGMHIMDALQGFS